RDPLSCLVSPCSRRCLLTVRAARSSASSLDTPRSSYESLMCSYWRSRFLLEPAGIRDTSTLVVPGRERGERALHVAPERVRRASRTHREGSSGSAARIACRSIERLADSRAVNRAHTPILRVTTFRPRDPWQELDHHLRDEVLPRFATGAGLRCGWVGRRGAE